MPKTTRSAHARATTLRAEIDRLFGPPSKRSLTHSEAIAVVAKMDGLRSHHVIEEREDAPEGDQTTDTAENFAEQPPAWTIRRLVAKVTLQAWRHDDRLIDVGTTEVDVTDRALALTAEELLDLADDRPEALEPLVEGRLIDPDGDMPHQGPFHAEVAIDDLVATLESTSLLRTEVDGDDKTWIVEEKELERFRETHAAELAAIAAERDAVVAQATAKAIRQMLSGLSPSAARQARALAGIA